DAWHEGGGERHHDGRSARPWPQFQDIAGAEIVDRRDRADLGAVGGDGAKSDEIGVVGLVGRRRRQTLARDEQPEIGEPLRRGARTPGVPGPAAGPSTATPPAPSW